LPAVFEGAADGACAAGEHLGAVDGECAPAVAVALKAASTGHDQYY
jgi:hypothetical protein